MSRTITVADVLEYLAYEVARAGEDYVYNDHFAICTLAWSDDDNEKPMAACLVGRVYADLDIPIADMIDWEGSVGAEQDGRSYDVRFEYGYGLKFTEGAQAVLRRAQYEQDAGLAYGEVLQQARAAARTEHRREPRS